MYLRLLLSAMRNIVVTKSAMKDLEQADLCFSLASVPVSQRLNATQVLEDQKLVIIDKSIDENSNENG